LAALVLEPTWNFNSVVFAVAVDATQAVVIALLVAAAAIVSGSVTAFRSVFPAQVVVSAILSISASSASSSDSRFFRSV